MLHPLQFDRAIVNTWKRENERVELSKFIGIDSEAYTNGYPFMFGTSEGDIITPNDFISEIFSPRYINANFLLWNLKYDVGAIVRSQLPIAKAKELQELQKTEFDGYIYTYIPHKHLKIAEKGNQKKAWVQFWDVMQFYRMSLDNASKKYLNDKKKKQTTKQYTLEYVRENWKNICSYCIKDAYLTKRLGLLFFDKLHELDLPVASIYSGASISSVYINSRMKVFTAHDWYYKRNRIVAYACEAYRGGKFEVTARGSGNVYAYDIVSAYPYEITNLIDIKSADYNSTKIYQKDAVYGYLRVCINNPDGKHLPTGIFKNGVLIYPAGRFYTTITKQEYEYMVFELDIDVEILQAEWLFVNRIRYPFRKVYNDIFQMKDDCAKGTMMYNAIKIIANGYYGKMVQSIPDKITGKIKVGQDWNPMYAAVITANTRIRVTRIQNELKSDCVAVHTDSVFTKVPLDKKYTKVRKNKKLGSWELEKSKINTILIASGVYQMGDKSAFRGVVPVKRKKKGKIVQDDWKTILKKAGCQEKFRYVQSPQPESFTSVMARNRSLDEINLFKPEPKDIDVNMDTKRVWTEKTNAKKLLLDFQYSNPHIISETKPPEYWKTHIPCCII